MFRTFKIIRKLSNSPDDMEDLVKFRLEESFGEIFVEGLEICSNSSNEMNNCLHLNSSSLEFDSFKKDEMKTDKILVSSESLFIKEEFLIIPKNTNQNSKNQKLNFIENKKKSNKQMHQFNYSFLSIFELEIKRKNQTQTIIVNHLHLELINFIRKIKNQRMEIEQIYEQFINQIISKFDITKSNKNIQYLFNQIISNKQTTRSLFIINAKNAISMSKDLTDNNQNDSDFARKYLEYLVMNSQIIFKQTGKQVKEISNVELESKVMYYLKKNKSATKQKLVSLLFDTNNLKIKRLEESIETLLKKSLIKLDETDANRIIYFE